MCEAISISVAGARSSLHHKCSMVLHGLARALMVVATAQRAQAQQSELTPIKIGLEWFLNPDHLPLVVALKEGYFADAGLEVSLVEPADHWEAEEEIIAGRLDVAVTETLHLAQDAARGIRHTAYGTRYTTCGAASSISKQTCTTLRVPFALLFYPSSGSVLVRHNNVCCGSGSGRTSW